MKHFCLNLLKSGSGISTMRFMSLICVISAVVLAFVGINKSVVDYSGLTMLCSAFLSAGFAGKVFQKNIETKINPS